MAGDACHSKQKQKLKNLNKGLWSREEDKKLSTYITRFGVGSWTSLPRLAGLERCGKSCRLRWVNYLRPGLKRGNFSQEEQDIILHLHQLLGNRWARIATMLPGRTDNEIKNFWNGYLKKKLIKQGIDPSTHKPTLVHEERNQNKTSFAYDQQIIIPRASPSALAITDELQLQEAFNMNNNGGLMTLGDDFMKNNMFFDEFEMGIDPIGFGCNLLAQYQQINYETASPSFDFSDTSTSRTLIDTFIKEASRESSSCTNNSNMTNFSAEILTNTTGNKCEEWNASEQQELQTVQASNAGDSDTYLTGLLPENRQGEYKSFFHKLIESMTEDHEFSHTNSFQKS